MRALALVALLAALTVGCGGDADFGSLDSADLAALPVPPQELGDAALGLTVDAEQSGYANNEAAAADTIDPGDDARDLAAAGRISGYNLGYYDEDLSRLASRTGVLEVVTGVDLFGTPEQAREFLQREIDDYRRLRGREIEEDVVLKEVDARRADDVGDVAWLVDATAEIAGVTVYGTFAAFARDRVVGAAVITRADAGDEAERVAELAGKLADRIERAARGELDEKPVPLVDADSRSAPRSAERLAKLVLAPQDLDGGARVTREGALPGGAYEREFDAGARVGRTRLLELESRVELAEDIGAARARLAEAGQLLSRQVNAAEEFARRAGAELRNARVRALPVGESGIGFRIEGDAAGERYAAVIVTVRVDRALGSLFAAGRADAVRDRDVLALAERLAARIAQGLGAA